MDPPKVGAVHGLGLLEHRLADRTLPFVAMLPHFRGCENEFPETRLILVSQGGLANARCDFMRRFSEGLYRIAFLWQMTLE